MKLTNKSLEDVLKEQRDWFKLGNKTHSSFYAICESKKYYQQRYVCYAAISNSTKPFDELVIIHNPTIKALYLREYVTYLLNSELFGKAFKTKTYDDGINYGFRVDVTQPMEYIFAAISHLRFPFECFQGDLFNPKNWSYPKFRGLGYSKKESMWLCRLFDNNFNKLPVVSGHLSIRGDCALKSWSSKSFNHNESYRMGNEGGTTMNLTANCWDTDKIKNRPTLSLLNPSDIEVELKKFVEAQKGL